MPVNGTLTPLEASYIATNAYFTLKDWIDEKPVAAIEKRNVVHNRVLGPGTEGKAKPTSTNPTLQGTALGSARLGPIFSATTGLGTRSGFGYVLSYKEGFVNHAIIATRGTRPELGLPDLLTDARAGMTGFGGYGPVHKGFKTTFDTVMASLGGAGERIVMDADVVHCVGHSLGGAVATLVAAHYRQRGKLVKLYSFGSPRVGAGGTYAAMQQAMGQHNVFRVAHDLDPISMVGPFPYIHLNPSAGHPNFMTIPSPTGSLFSTANHDMMRYIASVGGQDMWWSDAHHLSAQVDHDNAVLARWLLHEDNNPGWVRQASARTLGILFKLFTHVLRSVSTSVILRLTAVDMIAEMLVSGLYRMASLPDRVFTLLRHAATWAGVKMQAGADFTAAALRAILGVMMARLAQIGNLALITVTRGLRAMPLAIAGTWALGQAMPL